MTKLDISKIPTETLKKNVRALSIEAHDFKRILARYEQRPDKNGTVTRILKCHILEAQRTLPSIIKPLIKRRGKGETEKHRKTWQRAEQACKDNLNCGTFKLSEAGQAIPHLQQIRDGYDANTLTRKRILKMIDYDIQELQEADSYR